MYRNIVLTVIAICLVWICARDLAPWRHAGAAALPRGQQEPVRVVVQADERNPVPVSIQVGAGLGRGVPVVVEDVRAGAFRSAGPIDVRTR